MLASSLDASHSVFCFTCTPPYQSGAQPAAYYKKQLADLREFLSEVLKQPTLYLSGPADSAASAPFVFFAAPGPSSHASSPISLHLYTYYTINPSILLCLVKENLATYSMAHCVISGVPSIEEYYYSTYPAPEQGSGTVQYMIQEKGEAPGMYVPLYKLKFTATCLNLSTHFRTTTVTALTADQRLSIAEVSATDWPAAHQHGYNIIYFECVFSFRRPLILIPLMLLTWTDGQIKIVIKMIAVTLHLCFAVRVNNHQECII